MYVYILQINESTNQWLAMSTRTNYWMIEWLNYWMNEWMNEFSEKEEKLRDEWLK